MSEGIPDDVRRRLELGGGLEQLVRSLPAPQTVQEAADAFDAVSDPARLRMLWALDRAPLCPCLLREFEPMTNSALSYHLRLLRRAGLVATTVKSNYRIYRATARGRAMLSFLRRAVP